jgi:uncharacterized protein CbrC (UPF0167 family)
MRVVRKVGGLVWLASVLAAATLSLAAWTVSLTSQVAALTASATAAAVKAAREKAEIKAKMKAKARLRRMLVAIPIAGTAAAVYFEQADFEEWLLENPGGTFSEYACIQADLSAEIVDEVLAELPEETGLSADWLNQQQRALCEEEGPDSAHATAGSL